MYITSAATTVPCGDRQPRDTAHPATKLTSQGPHRPEQQKPLRALPCMDLTQRARAWRKNQMTREETRAEEQDTGHSPKHWGYLECPLNLINMQILMFFFTGIVLVPHGQPSATLPSFSFITCLLLSALGLPITKGYWDINGRTSFSVKINRGNYAESSGNCFSCLRLRWAGKKDRSAGEHNRLHTNEGVCSSHCCTDRNLR